MSLILEHQSKYFKNLEFTDFKIYCNEVTMNVHRVVLATHSRVFRHAMRVHPDRLDLSCHDLYALDHLLAIIYRGNYPDDLFGKGKFPHAIAALSRESLKNLITDVETADQHYEDKSDQEAMNQVFNKILRCDPGVMTLIHHALWDAVEVHILAHKYECDLAIAITYVRIQELAKALLLDTKEMIRTYDVDKFVLIMEKAYTQLPKGAPVRLKLCGTVREFCRKNPDKEGYAKRALSPIVKL